MIELVGLAYDSALTNQIWEKVPLKTVYDLILADEFRRKVDLRSMLYHKGHSDLLGKVESFLKQGGQKLTLVELLAKRFTANVEDFPSSGGELAFDFQLIRHFSSLAMVDDFMVADPFLRELLRRVGFLTNEAGWSLLEVRDFKGVGQALRQVQMQDVMDVGRKVGAQVTTPIRFENLVRNYIEFLNYAHNNSLTPFFYNSQSDFRRWGDLTVRKNQRNEVVVDLAMKPKKVPTQIRKKVRPSPPELEDLRDRMRKKRESQSLATGLRDSDPLIRQKVAESLGRLADPEVLPWLIQALVDDEPEVRAEVVRAVGAMSDESGLEALLNVMRQDEVQTVRLIAAYILREQGAKKMLPYLLDAVEEGIPHFSVILAYHSALSSDPPTLARLEVLACHENPVVRREVAFILGRIPATKSKGVLLRLVEDQDVETRCNALYALWDLGVKDVAEQAQHFGKDRSRDVARAGEIVGAWSQARAG